MLKMNKMEEKYKIGETERLHNIREKKLKELKAMIIKNYKGIYLSQGEEIDKEYVYWFFDEFKKEILK